jgi:hypothetical protein
VGKKVGCFPAGTPIATKEGSKPIEEVRVGDSVLSRDDETGEQSYQKVVRTFIKQSEEMLTIRTDDGAQIEATPEHPFWVQGKGFVKAKRLARSDLLVSASGHEAAVVSVTSRKGKFTVYNFEVANTHTYYAGKAAWWVHNYCGDDAVKLTLDAGDGWAYKIDNAVDERHYIDNLGGKEDWKNHIINISDDGMVHDAYLGVGGMPLDDYLRDFYRYPDVLKVTPLDISDFNKILGGGQL